MMDSYVSIDLETTGLNPKTDKIIEIGAVKVVGGEIKDDFPPMSIPAESWNSESRTLPESVMRTWQMHRQLLKYFPICSCFWENCPFWDTVYCLIFLF